VLNVRLRDGTATCDQRLAATAEWDPRNRDFGAARLNLKPTARVSRTWGPGAIYDQGLTGACVAFSWAHVLFAEPFNADALTYDDIIKTIYWPAQRTDKWPGGEYPGAKPIAGGTSILATAKVLQGLGIVDSYYWASSVQELALVLLEHGPVVLGLEWYEGMASRDIASQPGDDLEHHGGLLSGSVPHRAT